MPLKHMRILTWEKFHLEGPFWSEGSHILSRLDELEPREV
ncbi:unnamed protein product [Gulo gulo]|uniref:Uncharacterized protein n=1 Tax=Gulo gulo TaxID=48420 RepID=A0A9X9M0R5_GULGU|nr:unnamed protein product [Gulo gulo]